MAANQALADLDKFDASPAAQKATRKVSKERGWGEIERVEGREGVVESGIENGRVPLRGGGRVRDREGLRGNEGAYYVDKEIENGRGRGRGDLAFYTHPPTHTCLYVRTYITSQCAPSKLFLYMFPPSFLHHMFLVLGKLCTYEMTRTHTSTCKPRSLSHYMHIRKHIHVHLHILAYTYG
jgi:hypothetical protein